MSVDLQQKFLLDEILSKDVIYDQHLNVLSQTAGRFLRTKFKANYFSVLVPSIYLFLLLVPGPYTIPLLRKNSLKTGERKPPTVQSLLSRNYVRHVGPHKL